MINKHFGANFISNNCKQDFMKSFQIILPILWLANQFKSELHSRANPIYNYGLVEFKPEKV